MAETEANQAKEASEDQTEEAKKDPPLFRDVVFWTAVIGGIGAIAAAFVNAYVAYTNNNTLLDIETRKETEEQYIEPKKAEYTRLLEITKLDVDASQKKLNAFCEMLLITDPAICQAGALYQKNHPASQTNPPSQNNPPAKNTGTYSQTNWDSPWVAGGYTQQDICNSAIPELSKRPENSGKTLTYLNASEDSKKDFFGHVTYQYHCVYRVYTP